VSDASHTTTADIASMKFTLRDLIEEVSTLIWEKRQFLEGKIERRAIGEPEKNLALLRIRRLEVLHAYLKDGGRKAEENPAPAVETLPEHPKDPEPEPPAAEEPELNLDEF